MKVFKLFFEIGYYSYLIYLVYNNLFNESEELKVK